jgi:hypothetical protein
LQKDVRSRLADVCEIVEDFQADIETVERVVAVPAILDVVRRTTVQASTPAMYGFQSCISMPIILSDGFFFGALCAIDPRPARLNTPESDTGGNGIGSSSRACDRGAARAIYGGAGA